MIVLAAIVLAIVVLALVSRRKPAVSPDEQGSGLTRGQPPAKAPDSRSPD